MDGEDEEEEVKLPARVTTRRAQIIVFSTCYIDLLQGSVKRWVLGCVNSPLQPEGVERRDPRNLQGYSGFVAKRRYPVYLV